MDEGTAASVIRSKTFQTAEWISGKQRVQPAATASPGIDIDPHQLIADRQISPLRPEGRFFPTCGFDGVNGLRSVVSFAIKIAVL